MIRAEQFIEPAREAGFAWFAGVPCSFFRSFINYVIDAPGLQYLSAPNEGDAVAAMAGVALGGGWGVAMMQNSGLGNAVSPLTSLNWVFRLPMLLIVTWRGEPGVADEPQHELMGRITHDLLEAMDIPWETFPAQADDIGPALSRATRHLRDTGRPYALVMRKNTVADHPGSGRRPPFRAHADRHRVDVPPVDDARPTRRDALARLIELTPTDGADLLLATTGYTGRELYALADRDNQLYMVGSMGCASSLGLGLALARPDRRVVVIDGDGAALMRLGNLAGAAVYGGNNLVHLVLDNGLHESTGGQATLAGGVDFAAVARACGYGLSLAGDSLEVLDRALADGRSDGPRFAHLRLKPGVPDSLPRPMITPAEVARRLAAHMGAPS
ncbi:phosphonopyruvate decarboxylase [Spectribacter hydrogenoxidans]|uniref:Phosphonopyruvate decarboxylase n=1 Tax=Spectribacter hydrogenoxidans TaxID=3075608 RepID=A0ABU3C0D6_9GAMM|nr:phosphonopyruvate decarboxylase [Salinisphaera sp. W335]MDT0635027.1 phosphonopyruvate decarboxylase [Salinisphaera sp. W335]